MFGFGDKEQKQKDDDSTKKPLSGDSSVAEWLEHPSGGVVFRSMLEKAGQKESVLRPVRRMPLKKLVSMSRGQFTEEMMNDMIEKANSGQVSDYAAVTETPSKPETVKDPEKEIVSLPEWQEIITANRFANKTVIVTGAGSGIGRATASRLAREGARVIAVDISNGRLEEFKNELKDYDIVTVVADITKEEDINNIISIAGSDIDALANVAGIMDNMTPLHEVSDDNWERVINVNVTGMMRITRAVLPIMLRNHKGSIVNVGSEASLRGSAAGVAYTTSKHAVVGLTKSSAFMYGPSGIRINAVAPGPTITNIEAKFESKLGEKRVNEVLSIMPDAATAEELAASITFLLSDDSVNINGAILPSDNGWSVQ